MNSSDQPKLLKKLHKQTENSPTLKEALEEYNYYSKRLELSHQKLEQRFTTITNQLSTVQKQLKEKLSELSSTRSYLEALINSMTEGMIFINQEGLIVTCTNQAKKLLKIRKKVLQKNYWDLFEDTYLGFSIKRRLSEKSAPQSSMLTIPSQNRSIPPTILEVSPTYVTIPSSIQSESGKYGAPKEGLLILIRDMSTLHHLQSISHRNERLKELGELAASLAHEIRNPLGGIEGFAALLKQDLKDQPDKEKLCGHIIEGTQTLNRLVTDVLHYARPMKFNVQRQDLIPVIEKTVELAKASGWLKQGQTIHIKAPKRALKAPYDEDLLKSSLLNLIRNAAQAIGSTGSITIELSKKESSAQIKIIDNGSGIEPDYLANIFSPFFTTKHDGNGLGLYEVHKMLQTQGAQITVTSALGSGSTFVIDLPFKSDFIPQ